MKHSQLAAQLSTVRDDLLNASAFADTIKRLSAIGYPAVELIPSETVSDKEIARICEEAGVKIVLAHVLDNCSIDDMMADGDTVAIRYTMRGTHRGSFAGVPATGKAVVAQSMAFYRLAGGKIVEERTQLDMLGVLQQLGAVPRT